MRVTIENFPPIASGSFDLRPLTLFIGPNNTGKSRAALLPYLLTKTLEPALPSVTSLNGYDLRAYWEGLDWTAEAYREFADLVRKELVGYIDQTVHQQLPRAIRRYLLHDIGSVDTALPSGASIRFEASERLAISISGSATEYAEAAVSETRLDDVLTSTDPGTLHRDFPNVRAIASSREMLTRFKSKLGLPTGNAHILPAERGSLASLINFYLDVVLDSASTERSRELLPAPVGDFLSTLIRSASLHAAAKGGLEHPWQAVETIERHVLKGRVAAAGNASIPLPLVFSNIFEEDAHRFTISLSAASSSVSQAGPIAMILKSHVKPGDLVVIDEPETNLHPENQRRMAQALVRLAAAGVTVLASTHSSTIMYELSNLARASALSADTRAELGLEDADRLRPDDIGVYLFRPGPEGTIIEEIPFDSDGGYPEETFIEVAEALGDESFWLDTKLQPVSG